MKSLYRCQIFTPEDKVHKLLDIIDYRENLFGKKFLENSCGDGSVLKQVLFRYIIDCKKKQFSLAKIKFGIENDIWAFEIDTNKYNDCICNLNNIAKSYGLIDVNWNIHKCDFLKYDIKQKFSYIAGNPPYMNYRDLTIETREFIKNNFITCRKGKFDYCYAFIEKSINCLTDNGKLSYLIPSSIFKNVFAENLRKHILPLISKIYDFKTKKVFSQALVATSILVCEKGNTNTHILYNNDKNKKVISIPKSSLNEKWIFRLPNTTNTHKKARFGDFFNAQIAIATLLNCAFIFKDKKITNNMYEVNGYKIEKSVTRSAKSPRNLAYDIKERIIFPYFYRNNKLCKYTITEFENKYPETVKYLKCFKTRLDNRNKDTSAQWFEYGRSQALAHLNQDKLLISTVITDKLKVYKLKKEEIPYAGIYITSKNGTSLDIAYKILNSEDFLTYVTNIGIQASGTSLRITPKDVNNFEFCEGNV